MRPAIFAAAFVAIAGCATTSEETCPVVDGSPRGRCMRGPVCGCDDTSGTDVPGRCVNGVVACPAGYTPYEQCRGVPPGPECWGPKDAGEENANPFPDAAFADTSATD